jgi:MFS family permease
VYSGRFMSNPGDRLFTGSFFIMCGFTFTVFLSAFQLLPTAPFRILELGGSKLAAGLFLGLLTYASALSAPFTGALADRIGKRRMLVLCSLAITGFSVAYGLSTTYAVPLGLVFFHGLFWSGLLSASSAYMTDVIPESRRAEGIGYWGMSSMLAVSVAPSLGLWVFHRGWGWLCAVTGALNLAMAIIATTLPETSVSAWHSHEKFLSKNLVEWRVLAVSLALFLYSFGYGGVTSFVALFAEASGISPRGIFFTTFAIVVIATRLAFGRLADRVGHRKVFLPCLVLIVIGFILLAWTRTFWGMVLSATVFATGFGNAYPAYAAHVTRHVAAARRGAAFGGIVAAFDTGIGTGSICTGWIIQHFGFRPAFATAATLSALAMPYFLFAEGRWLRAPREA